MDKVPSGFIGEKRKFIRRRGAQRVWKNTVRWLCTFGETLIILHLRQGILQSTVESTTDMP